jgi:hypothetical protein
MTTGGDESRISLNGFLEVKELGAGKRVELRIVDLLAYYDASGWSGESIKKPWSSYKSNKFDRS